MRKAPLLFLFLVCAACAFALPRPKVTYPAPPEVPEPGQHVYSSRVQYGRQGLFRSKVQVNYLLYIPRDYGKDATKKWPLLLFLHGYGERGDDLQLLKKHPLPKLLDAQADFPFLVVSPQLSSELFPWTEMLEPLKALLDRIAETYAVDRSRISVTGLSMGGAGTWEMGLRYPRAFAALVPIAGFYRLGSREVPADLAALKEVPIWAFHGAADTSVPAWESEILVKALQQMGSNVRFTLYPDADHEQAWLRAYADPALYDWLAAQRLR
jgi:predicted peptidase